MITFNHNHDEKIQNMAILCQQICAERGNGRNKCTAEDCKVCPVNVENVVPDKSQAALYHVGATMFSFRRAVMIFGFLCCFALLAYDEIVDRIETKQRIESYNNSKPKDTAYRPTFSQAKLDRVLRQVQKDVRWGRDDADGDGKIDCCDYALRFHELYGEGSYIIQNYQKGVMNHLFNEVEIAKDLYWCIEPQLTSNYIMPATWGSKYNPAYNRDVTYKWKRGNRGGYSK